MRNFIGIGLLGMFLLTGCVFWGDTYHKKEITAFSIERKDNPNLPLDLPARIDQSGRSIVLRFPNSVAIQPLVPRFQFSGLSASLDGKPFGSGSQAVDFSTAHVVGVIGVDEETQTYSLEAKYQAKVFRSFEFRLATNPGLSTRPFLYFDSPYYGNGYWLPDYGYVEDFTVPTTVITASLPDNAPTSLVPTFDHNAVEVRWKGQPLVSGTTAIDATTNQVLTLVGADGSTQDVALKFTYQPLALTEFQLLAADNPTLRKDYVGNINQGTHVISVAVPNYVNPANLVARFIHNGVKAMVDGIETASGMTALNLSANRTFTLVGAGNRTQDYQLLVTPVSPSSSKQVLSRALYGSVSRTPPFVPSYGDRISYFTETSPATDVYNLTVHNYYYNYPIDPALIYLEIQTTAILVKVGQQTVTPGLLTDEVYSPANWLNFTNPVVLTLTAEDLTTKTITLNLVVQ